MNSVSVVAVVAASLALGACASTDHRVDHDDNLLEAPGQNESLGEQLQRAQQDGCLAGGNALRLGCEDEREAWADLLSPPELPEGVDITPLPSPPEQPD